MDQRKTKVISQKVFHKQPIMCPWVTSQPYPSALLNKNRRLAESNINCSINNNLKSKQMESKSDEKSCPSMQQSSSQFFYFLRLMQLFPDTHPATLHTVLTLCKNDFFCAVDKLLYAKRCKIMYNRRQSLYQKFCHNRTPPYTNNINVKATSSQQKEKIIEKPNNAKTSVEKSFETVSKQSVIVKTNETLPEVQVTETITMAVPDLSTSVPLSPNKSCKSPQTLSRLTVENDITDMENNIHL